MPEYRFITGEVFSVMANDAEHARRIINRFFEGEWDDDPEVEDEDIQAINYVESTTMLLDD